MAKIEQVPKVKVELTLTLSEEEAAALNALAHCDADKAVQFIADNYGVAYIHANQDGLRSLFASVKSTVPYILARASTARRAFVPE